MATKKMNADAALQEPEQYEMTQQDQAYMSGLMKMLHSKQTSGKIVAMLKSAPPEQSVPATALTVNAEFESRLKEKGQQPSLETRVIAGTYLVSDLAEIGNAAAAWDQPLTQEDLPLLMEGTMEKYIAMGLKDGSIDPVELQQKVEPLMSDEHRALGMEGAAATGIPMEANELTAMEQYGAQRERKAMNKAANAKAAENRKGMMQGGGQ